MSKNEKMRVADILEAHSDSLKIEKKNVIGFSDENQELKINTLIKAVFIDSSHQIVSESHYDSEIKPGDKCLVVTPKNADLLNINYPSITVLNSRSKSLVTLDTLSFINLFADSELPED